MTDLEAVGIAEGFLQENDPKKIVKAWQHLIDTGMAWELQGWFGRTATLLIEEGICTAAPDKKDE